VKKGITLQENLIYLSYKDGILDYCEAYYNVGNFYERNREQDFDNKFGSFDLETMANEDHNKDLFNRPI
jgi:hypothetical protein